MTHEPAIKLDNVSKAFRVPGDEQPGVRGFLQSIRPVARHSVWRPVLTGISFEVQRGETLGIIGRNGVGKSTLMRIMAGIYEPDSGTVEINGTVAPFLEMGVGFNPQLAVEDNVVINGTMLGMRPAEMRERREAIMETAGVLDLRRAPLKVLSSGMRVRLGFSVMREARPEILLIDEVLAVGDAEFRRRSADGFSELKEAGCTIVVVTHSLEQIKRLCDRALLVSDGRVAQIGTPDEVVEFYEAQVEAEFDDNGTAQGADQADHSARIRTLDVLPLPDSGRHCTGVEIIAEVVAADAIAGVRLGFEIFSRGGPIGRARTKQSAAIDLEPGRSKTLRATCTLPLAPGRYRTSTSLLGPSDSGPVPIAEPREEILEVPGAPVRPDLILGLDLVADPQEPYQDG